MDNRSDSRTLFIVAGTRPEVIKLAPVYFSTRKRFGSRAVRWVSTGQHRMLETQTLASFGIVPDFRLKAHDHHGSLLKTAERVTLALGELLRRRNPDLVIVQGDTVSAYAAAFAAFHRNVPVGHVEAGLRTYDAHDPFPEEAYRRMIAPLATVHFAPTSRAAGNLYSEGCEENRVCVTGNTVVDALAMVDRITGTGAMAKMPDIPADKRLLFVTLHRRESWGTPLSEMCLAVKALVKRYKDVHVVFPVHVNPVVQRTVHPLLDGVRGITLLRPVNYAVAHALIRRAYAVLTDSGGIQEEAPSYGVPVLVLRCVTERPEAVDAGMAILTGTEHDAVFREACRLLDDADLREQMRAHRNPFGDGKAAGRIVTAVERLWAGTEPLLDENEQFAG